VRVAIACCPFLCLLGWQHAESLNILLPMSHQ
jgi:hypothetical protein